MNNFVSTFGTMHLEALFNIRVYKNYSAIMHSIYE